MLITKIIEKIRGNNKESEIGNIGLLIITLIMLIVGFGLYYNNIKSLILFFLLVLGISEFFYFFSTHEEGTKAFKIYGFKRKLNENNAIKRFVEKHNKIFKYTNYISIFICILLMVSIVGLTFHEDIKRLNNNAVPIILPVIPYQSQYSADLGYLIDNNIKQEYKIVEIKKASYISINIFYYLIIILLITSIHEFGHLLYFYHNGIKAKEYGIGIPFIYFLPVPLPMAYVKEEGEEFKALNDRKKCSVVCSGVFFNVIFGIIFIILYNLFPIKLFNYLWIFNIGVGAGNMLFLWGVDGHFLLKSLLKGFKIIKTEVSMVAPIILIIGIVVTIL